MEMEKLLEKVLKKEEEKKKELRKEIEMKYRKFLFLSPIFCSVSLLWFAHFSAEILQQLFPLLYCVFIV
jgi:hypothetical protein